MARKIASITVLGTGEKLTPEMYVQSSNNRGNAGGGQWDFVVKEAMRAQDLFKITFADEVSEDPSGERTYSKDELESMTMKELIGMAKLRGVKHGGLGKTELVEAIAADMG